MLRTWGALGVRRHTRAHKRDVESEILSPKISRILVSNIKVISLGFKNRRKLYFAKLPWEAAELMGDSLKHYDGNTAAIFLMSVKLHVSLMFSISDVSFK